MRELDVRSIILGKNLEVLFQPIVSLSLNRIIAFEALGRAYDEEGKLIPPGRLFSSAKKQGIAMALDFALQEKALERFAQLRMQEDCLLFLNLEEESIKEADKCLTWLQSKARYYGVRPQNVVLEVLEAEMEEETVQRFFYKARKLGFNVALDDFGVKHSNLERLLKLEPSFVKVDREIIKYIRTDRKRRVVVSSLHEALKNLGIFSLAEGVDDEEDVLFLLSIGFSIYQGFYFYKPMRYNEINHPLLYDTRIESIHKKLTQRLNMSQKLIENARRDVVYMVNTIADVGLSRVPPYDFDRIIEEYLSVYKDLLCLYVVEEQGHLVSDVHIREDLKGKVERNPMRRFSGFSNYKPFIESFNGDYIITDVYVSCHLGMAVRSVIVKFGRYYLFADVEPDF